MEYNIPCLWKLVDILVKECFLCEFYVIVRFGGEEKKNEEAMIYNVKEADTVSQWNEFSVFRHKHVAWNSLGIKKDSRI